ncbi:MAG: hypothetical protein QNJ54_15820 [Prochloraceae cyanobacterium]|nr:hypothetical protein [Prochloraceae cyanobacterium]
MNQFRRYGNLIFGSLFAISLSLTIVIYLLRGFGIVTSISGGIILVLIALSLITGIIFGIEWTKRF